MDRKLRHEDGRILVATVGKDGMAVTNFTRLSQCVEIYRLTASR